MENKSYEVIINGVGKNVTRKEDKDVIEKIFNNYKTDSLILRTVGQICESQDNFYIANYQRGYRWGKDEVEALLKDIYEVYKKDDREQKYCLQPLVVKKRKDQEYTRTLKNLIEGISKQDNKLEQEAENQRKVDGEIYELLDGQQRLTTLWLILSELDRNQKTEGKKESENKTYQIYYELLRRVDKDFIEQASGIIKNWIEKDNPEGKNLNKSKYRDVILGNLTFLWYEVTNGISKVDESTDQNVGNNDSEKLFRKINKGKIDLTNAELFKAMLLNEENARTEEDRRELEQISFEWDSVEQSLRNDEFWFFISNDTSEERTRIDYILEVYARGLKVEDEEIKKIEDETKKKEFKKIWGKYKADLKKLDVNKDRYSFLAVNKYLEYCQKTSNGMTLKGIWKDIVSVHDKLYSWYQDNELYHNIGFLVACEGKTCAAASETIVDLYVRNAKADIEKMRQDVLKKIKEQFCQIAKNIRGENGSTDKDALKTLTVSINYKDISKADLRKFLLYSNIYPIIKVAKKLQELIKEAKEKDNKDDMVKSLQKSLNETHLERFPFKKYYQIDWDIEHINPETPIGTINDAISVFEEDEVKSKYKKAIRDYLKAKNCDENDLATDEGLQECWERVGPKDGEDYVSNLVLLDSSTNRQYHNAIFGYKRYCIIQREQEGKYVPPQTRKVFLKYNDKNPEWIEWTDENQEKYETELIEMLNYVETGK